MSQWVARNYLFHSDYITLRVASFLLNEQWNGTSKKMSVKLRRCQWDQMFVITSKLLGSYWKTGGEKGIKPEADQYAEDYFSYSFTCFLADHYHKLHWSSKKASRPHQKSEIIP